MSQGCQQPRAPDQTAPHRAGPRGARAWLGVVVTAALGPPSPPPTQAPSCTFFPSPQSSLAFPPPLPGLTRLPRKCRTNTAVETPLGRALPQCLPATSPAVPPLPAQTRPLPACGLRRAEPLLIPWTRGPRGRCVLGAVPGVGTGPAVSAKNAASRNSTTGTVVATAPISMNGTDTWRLVCAGTCDHPQALRHPRPAQSEWCGMMLGPCAGGWGSLVVWGQRSGKTSAEATSELTP